ncbi:MAG: thermonuclease family protein [Oscillatoria sp. PMC 1051.18]|nr:thermonuclease family protein [Oscillatoria sp. PMC 1050.18]MEC5032925.1 thermonuclease family protein [Oscillatoria sp. PMC 1051.18]
MTKLQTRILRIINPVVAKLGKLWRKVKPFLDPILSKLSKLGHKVKEFLEAIFTKLYFQFRFLFNLGTYPVKRVPDGDTIVVVDKAGKSINVRFAWIDTPEIPHSKAEEKSRKLVYKSQFKWGYRAKERVEKLIAEKGNKVFLKITDTDRYGRKVCEIRLRDGTFLQEVLVKEGLSQIYERYFKKCRSTAILVAAEKDAKRWRRGLWRDQKFVPAWEFRRLDD